MKLPRRLLFASIVLLPLLLIVAGWILLLLAQQGGLEPFRVPTGGERRVDASPALVERGQYLARLGNCAGCHTRHGGTPYAGGRAFATPYGTIYSSNISSDPVHGIGAWTREEFRHTMRHGISRNGVQSPVFPYANFAHLPQGDVDALFAFLATVPASSEAPTADVLEFPASLPGAMTAWRLLYYRPVVAAAAPDAPPQWQRGRELVTGIGHCAVCHATRGSFASLADAAALEGARIPGWYAPALNRQTLAHYAEGELALYLRGATVADHSAYGRMADVIAVNLQHLQSGDADAVETYLRSLPPPRPLPRTDRGPIAWKDLGRGEQIYREHCADCHGGDGRGKAGKYPALTNSSAVTGPDPINAVKLVLFGAAAPNTALNARPYTMPPFARTLSSADVAAVVNVMRKRWGNPERAVSAEDVSHWGGLEPR